ncbi:MAG: TetR/AcrR family transcriptional regulator [Oscillospiraceae bacterium]
MTTREKLMDTALTMFSTRGFSAVSVRNIAYAVGVKESAMYKHFANKQALFDALVEEYMQKSDAFMGGIGAVFTNDTQQMNRQADVYGRMNDEEFLQIAASVFTNFLMKDEVKKFWRMISIEQYNNPDMADIFNRLLFEQPMQFQTVFFGMLVEAGQLKKTDPAMLAMAFYTPALMMYLRTLPYQDGHPVAEESLQLFKAHMMEFRKTYAHTSKEDE